MSIWGLFKFEEFLAPHEDDHSSGQAGGGGSAQDSGDDGGGGNSTTAGGYSSDDSSDRDVNNDVSLGLKLPSVDDIIKDAIDEFLDEPGRDNQGFEQANLDNATNITGFTDYFGYVSPEPFDYANRMRNEQRISKKDILKGIETSIRGNVGLKGVVEQTLSVNFGNVLGSIFGAVTTVALTSVVGPEAANVIGGYVGDKLRDEIDRSMLESIGEPSTEYGFDQEASTRDRASGDNNNYDVQYTADMNEMLSEVEYSIRNGGVIEPDKVNNVISSMVGFPFMYQDSASKELLRFFILDKFRDVFGDSPFDYSTKASVNLFTTTPTKPKAVLDKFADNQIDQVLVDKLF